MSLNRRRLAAAAAALVVLAGTGAAYAAGSRPAAAGAGKSSVLTAITAYLGLSAKQLGTDLASGQSLAQIATAQGKTVDGLEQTIESAAKSDLDQAVAAGKLSGDQEQAILAQLHAHIDALVHQSRPGAAFAGGLIRQVVKVAAGYLGLTPAKLTAQLKAGKTLAQIATAQGKTVAGLEQALTKAAKAQLDLAVASGTMTTQHEQQLLARLNALLAKLVSQSFPH
jgi:hypothetical protein